MEKLIKQHIFSTALMHLRKQGKQAVDSSGRCTYRGAAGSCCALGVLIKDRFYGPSLEGRGPGSPDVRAALVRSLGLPDSDEYQQVFSSLYEDLLHSIQIHMHDHNECTDPQDFINHLECEAQRIAQRHGLFYA